jgi:hypothetical protein
MKDLIKKTAVLICFTAGFLVAAAQENKEEKKEEETESFKPHSSLTLLLSHAHVFKGSEAGKRKTLALPAWAIDYNYHFSPKWAVGLHTDIVLEAYEIEFDKTGGTLKRSYPIAPALTGMYKLNEHWTLSAGAGGEFAKEENFFLTRFGAEYGVEIRHGWELVGALTYDIKWNGYDSWILGLGISKALGRHK